MDAFGPPPAIPKKRWLFMKINFIGRQMEIEESMKELASKKLAKFDKFFAEPAEATVRFSRIREKECLEITIVSGSTIFRCEEKNETFQNALDECVESIERQIRKYKTRLGRKLKTGALPPVEPDVEEEGEFRIRTKYFVMRPMTPEEAILQMNLLNHEFFTFHNSETGTISTVYKQASGGYGLIIPVDKG